MDALLGSTALTASTNMLLAALGMASGVVAARLLGPQGRGELSAIQTWPGFIALLAVMGMPEAVVYNAAKAPERAGRFLASAIVIGFAAGLPLMCLGYALMPTMLRAQRPEIVAAGRWYLFIVLVLASEGMMTHPLRGRGDFVAWNAMRVLPLLGWLAVLAVAWAARRSQPTFVAAGALIAQALLIVPFAAVVRRRVPGPFLPDVQRMPAMLRYGLPCTLAGVPQTLNLRLDQMLMAALVAPLDLGLYVVAVAWSGAVAPLLNALAATLMPTVASAADGDEAARRIAAGTRMAALLGCTLWIALSAVTPAAIVVLFGARFKAAVPAALVLVPAGAVLGFNLVLEEGLRGMGRPQAVLRAELAGLPVTAATLALTLRPLGIMGAALSSLLGYSTVAAVLLLSVRRHAGVSIRTALWPRLDELRLVVRQLPALISARQALAGE